MAEGMDRPRPSEQDDDRGEAPDGLARPEEALSDELAERILREELDQDEAASPGDEGDEAEAGGLTWIRSTLRSGGDQEDERVGSLFHGKYRILRQIGTGGFGVVYDALDERGAQNRVALKVMRDGLTGERSPLEMFRGEAVRVTRLHHPNIVDWKSFDRTPDGTYYFVMELLDGEQLSNLLAREGSLEWRRAGRLLLQILDALRAAHFVGEGESILHLDLTPKNILLLPARRGRTETVKVIDFGIGQYLGGEELEPLEPQAPPGAPPPVPAQHPGGLTTITSGTKDEERFRQRAARFPFKISQACTPEYASPEQCAHIEFADGAEREPRQLDGRADLYSVGVIAYRMLTGRLPFREPATRSLYLRLHQEKAIEPWGEAEARVPAFLRRFVERCLEKDPDARFRDTQEAHEELELLLRPSRRWRFFGAAVGLVLLGAVLARFLVEEPRGAFDLLAEPGGSAVEAVVLGSSRRSAELFLGDARGEPLDHPDAWQLVGSDGGAIAGFEARAAQRAGWVEIVSLPEQAREHPGRRAEERVRLQAVGDPESSSRASFRLVWLGRESWEHELTRDDGLALELPCEDGDSPTALVLDPRGLELALEFQHLQREDLVLSACRLLDGEDELPFELDGNSRLARVELGLEELPEGSHELRVELTDRAGSRLLRPLSIEVRKARPRFELVLREAKGDGRPWKEGETPKVLQEAEPELLITCDRELRYSAVLPDGPLEGALKDGTTVIPLDPLVPAKDFEGVCRLVLQLSDPVVHAVERRDDHEWRFQLEFEVVAPRKVRLALGTGDVEPDPDEETIFGPEAEILFVVSASPEDDLETELKLMDEAGEPLLEESTRERRVDLRQLAQAMRAPLPDGRYTLEAEVYLLDADGARQTESPNTRSGPRPLLLDRTAPEIALARGGSEESRIASGADFELQLVSEGTDGADVELRWELFTKGAVVVPLRRTASKRSDGQREFRLRPFAELGAGAPDGDYQLHLSAVDLAGNSTDHDPVDLELARDGPHVELETPRPFSGKPTTLWNRVGTERALQAIEVDVFDPNGVDRVSCAVLQSWQPLGKDAPPPADLERLRLERGTASSSGVEQRHEWELKPAPRWSGQEHIWISIEARDLRGNTSWMNEGPFRLPRLLAEHPPRVGEMWLVPGNGDEAYVFGGSDPDAENDRRARHGLGRTWVGRGQIRTGTTRETWSLELAPGAIDDFYLDPRKVTVGDYLEFLQVAGGYADPRHWPLGAVPGPERIEVLLREYGEREAGEPAIGLRFDEAAAYAAWTDRRLPTLLELEYATRGESGRRVFSWDGGPPPGDALDEDDPFGRVRGLSRGAEWTCTPEWAPEHADARHLPVDPAALALPSRERLRNARSFWIHGRPTHADYEASSWQHYDFRAASERQRGRPAPRLGFRCALSAAEAGAWRDPRPSRAGAAKEPTPR